MPTVTIIGAGVIGLSWAKLFADADWEVRVHDPDPEALADTPFTPVADLSEALTGTDFVQENGPERLELKQQLFTTAAQVTGPEVVLASSSSSLLPSNIAEGNPAADRILIGHPFNPPQLMPLVEVVPSPSTSAAAVDRALEVYQSLGQRPVRLQHEIPGFVGNRLQKAFTDQAMYLVQQGIIEPAELDRLVQDSLGLRWATIGPFAAAHLGGGPEGIRHIAANVSSQMTFEMGAPDPKRMGEVFSAVEAAYGTGEDVYERMTAQRDDRTRAVRAALDKADD